MSHLDHPASNQGASLSADSIEGHLLVARCRGVTKSFGKDEAKVMALRGVDLDIYSGDLTLLVGPSGCGKTTLLTILAAMLHPSEGSVEVLGEDLTHMPAGKRTIFRRERLGFVFQQFNLIPSLNAVENVCVPLLIAGWNRKEAIDKSKHILEEMGMGRRLKSMPNMLSGGEQQRVAIGRSLVHGPPLIVCDEPTSALDAKTGHRIMELLRKEAVKPGRGVIVVTHDPRVYDFADRIATMEDGKIQKVEDGVAASNPPAPSGTK